MTIALSTLLLRGVRELDVGLYIPNGDITAFGATSMTAANSLRNSLWGTTKFSDMQTVIYRGGAASSADYERFAGDLTNSTGALAHTGANYSDTTVGSENVLLTYWGVRPVKDLIPSINRVCEFEFVTGMHMLSALSRVDGGMEKTTDTDWTDVGTPTTSAKTTSQSTQIIPFGPRAYQLVGDATNEGTRSAAILMGQARNVSAFGIVAADVGTASFQLYDSTNSAAIGTAVTHSERRAMLVAIRNQAVPSTCKAVSLSLLGTTNPSTIYWNQVGIYPADSMLYQLPAFITESFMAPRLYMGVPKYQIATDVWDAESLDFVPLTEGQDYRIVTNHQDAEPYKVQFTRALWDWPVFVEYRRSLNDITGDMTTDTDTVHAVMHSILPKIKKDWLETIYASGVRRREDWQLQYNLADSQIKKAQAARPILHQGPDKPYYFLRSIY